LYRNFLFYHSPSPPPSPPFAGERGRVRGLNLIEAPGRWPIISSMGQGSKESDFEKNG
jgi:hypothetical protein